MKKKLTCAIVTGASGFIGQALLRFLTRKKIAVVGVVRRESFQDLFQSPLLTYMTCSMEHYDKLPQLLSEKGLRPDVFYHLAWDGTAGSDRADYRKQCRNACCICDAAIVAKEIGCHRFVVTGTVTEFVADDLIKYGYTAENLMYGLSKAYAHKLLDIVARKQGLDYVWARLSNIYGGQNGSGNLISYTMKELRFGHMPTYGPCEQPYNFTYINDVLEALYLLGSAEKLSRAEYFISNGECRLLKEYLQSLVSLMGGKIGIGMRSDDGVRYQKIWFDSSHLQEELGFRPKYQFEDGIKEIMQDEYKV
ncbi:NAD-dependent epimerase/dehydratase family protein [Selenomonas ruminantium]|uniref:Nucleoside-diphosphate-sugar epimerase n=1 Tax=Selenomonas ruminantium TaxID=971 RepID=A0A1H0PNT8_SELRU|nr:NAD(P)-dependent oxidoreductase [Selenomonas ruminantium]SDP06266.1 Nucleoside-diphosphate-sugar epimerase [Selenomonas ruminantium]